VRPRRTIGRGPLIVGASRTHPSLFVGVKGEWVGGKVTGHEVFRTGPNRYNIYYTGAAATDAPKRGIGLIQARLVKE
jgi:hypothetical protein